MAFDLGSPQNAANFLTAAMHVPAFEPRSIMESGVCHE